MKKLTSLSEEPNDDDKLMKISLSSESLSDHSPNNLNNIQSTVFDNIGIGSKIEHILKNPIST